MTWRGWLKRLLAVMAVAVTMTAATARAEGPLGPPSATIRFETRSVALGIGLSWGKGVLVFDGQEHTFSVSGLTVVDVGVSKVIASGSVYGLRELSQFDGTYYGFDIGVAVGGGTAGLAMRNQNGVYIKLSASQQGVKLSVASKGTTLKLD
jgi:hypothetical protein